MSKFWTNFSLDWDYILLSYYEDGKKYNKKVKLKPYLFVPSALESEYKTFDGKDVMRVDFDSVKEAREFARSYDGSPNFKIYGTNLYQYAYIYENFKEVNFDRDIVKVFNFDIEVDTEHGYPDMQAADKEINIITFKLLGKKDVYTLGLGDWDPTATQEKEILKLKKAGYRFNYTQCKDERDLLFKFMQAWQHMEPDFVTGWNIKTFDVRYLIKRLSMHFADDFVRKLSPFGKLKMDTITIFNRENDIFEIIGVPTLDYIDLYRKFSMNVEQSYSLNYLSDKLLGAPKLDYSEYGSLGKLQVQNWQKFTEYNIIDVIRVEQIDEVVKYMDVAFEIGVESKTNFVDSLTTIRVWDVMIHNYLMDQKRVVPYSSDNRKERQIAGGFVKEPQIGKHKWVMSFDFSSLYPTLCMTFNISPDTFMGTFKPIYGVMAVEKLLRGDMKEHIDDFIKNNACISGGGAVYSNKKQGFIPALMESLFAKKDSHSQEADKYEKLAVKGDEAAKKLSNIFAIRTYAIKILLNGGYGALSNEFYRFFADDIAESFTLSGQFSIKTVEKVINRKLNELLGTTDKDYIIAIDTDSVYVSMSDVVDNLCEEDPVDFLEKFSDTVQGWIGEALEEIYTGTNAFKKSLKMSLESIGPAIWVRKKRYVMSLPSYKKIRYNPPKIKIMGIEAVRSTTPKIVREWITDAIPIALEGNQKEIKQYVDDKWETFIKSPFAEIAMPKGTNDLEKYMDKNNIYAARTPMHVRGALLFNNYIKENNLTDIEPIRSGDKVKCMYLKMPNPLMENVIAIPEELPKDLYFFNDYVDLEKQFDKCFLDPLKRITDAAEIDLSTNISMENFFE